MSGGTSDLAPGFSGVAEHRHFAAVVVQVGMHHDKGPRASGDEHAPSGLTSRIGTRAGAEMIVSAVSSAPARPLVVSTLGSSGPRRAPWGRCQVVARAGKKYLHLGTRAVSTFSSHSRTVSAQQTQAPGLDEETVTRLRADTPGLEGFVERTPEAVAHFNNAGSSLPPKSVLDAQLEYLEREAVAGGYETVEERAVDLQRPYVAIAALLNCDPSEIAIGQSATSMWQAAFGCFDFRPGDRILTARAEYASNAIAYLQAAERTGAVVEFVPCDERGQLDALELERTIADETKGPVRLVSVTHVPTSGGLVNPASAIGAVTSRHGIPYLLDACQSVGQMPVDVEEIGCDLLVGTGRKYLRGPRGVGFLYAREEFVERTNAQPAMLDLHGARWDSMGTYVPAPGAKRFEQYEVSFAAKVGLGVAAEYALAVGVEGAWERIKWLAECARRRLEAIDGVTVWDVGEEKCGIISFSVDGVDSGDVRRWLGEHGCNVWTSKVAINTRAEYEAREESEDMPEEVIRASVHYFNAEWEVDKLCAAVEGLWIASLKADTGEIL